MKYITHKRSDGEYQLLSAHLTGVSTMSAQFASDFDAMEHAARTGLLHDIGKYSPAAQRRQRDPEHTAKVDHSTAGAKVAFQMRDPVAAFAVAGHHGGLPDPGSKSSPDGSMLIPRLQKVLAGDMDASAWQQEINVEMGELLPVWLKRVVQNRGFANAMYTRMLFSCLVDADYLDTESFMQYGKVERGSGESMAELLERLRAYVDPWLSRRSQGINRIRSSLLDRCMHGDLRDKGLYTLTIPTGGGKTISSLAFALSHAVRHGQSRVIYVVPYTSIIEQNAQVFREILGAGNVLEHHANVDIDDEESKHRLATENWDAPVVVTTAVQFFESLFAARTSRCRKLHNIANSVVIFDEAQMLPVPYLKPCVNAIAELVQHYGVTAVLCTATQPALDELIKRYAPELVLMEICPGTKALFDEFCRTRLVQDGTLTKDALASSLTQMRQALCIVNTRKMAQEIFAMLPEEGRYHLSTLMTPEHRAEKLRMIRERLKDGEPCRVVSTSLIEAGVDVDFPEVWRELAGLDSILQAAGRCNREGKRSVEDSRVHVFRFEGTAPRMIRQNTSATEYVLKKFSDISSPEAIDAYFRELLFLKGDDALDSKKILQLSEHQCFHTIEKEFRLIEEETIPVYIPTAENCEMLQQLRNGFITRGLLRRLGRSAVNVRPDHLERLKAAMAVEELVESSCAILAVLQHYDQDCGLELSPEGGDVWIC